MAAAAPRRRAHRICSLCGYISVAIFAVIFSFFYLHLAGRPAWVGAAFGCAENATFAESYDPAIEMRVKDLFRNFLDDMQLKQPFQPMRRGQHAKSIACLRATFEVDANVPEEYRHGIFSKPGSFPAWIRYSPGQSDLRSDREDHARGMAIKVMGVDGPKLLEDEKQTQDFVLLNSPIFFTGNTADYIPLIPQLETPWKILGVESGMWKLFGLVVYAAKVRSFTDNPLTHTFYSATPYKLGNNMAVKYMAQPCRQITTEFKQGNAQMRDAIRASLDPRTGSDLCYNFFVQKRENICSEPIEDATIPWNTEYIKVATLKLPKQDFMFQDQFAFCENLSYNPWHSLEAHKPLGSINHVRKLVYTEGAKWRRAEAGVVPVEPVGNEVFVEPIKDVNFDLASIRTPAGNTKQYSYGTYSMEGSNLTSLPRFIPKLPPGEKFASTTFIAIILRMLVGEPKSNEDASESNDSLLEREAEKLLDYAIKYANAMVSKKNHMRRAEEMDATAPQTTSTELDSARNAIFKLVAKKFKLASEKPSGNSFGMVNDFIRKIFMETSDVKISKFTDPEDYKKLFSLAFATDQPFVSKRQRWRTDEGFAEQTIRGVNPTWIRRAKQVLPADLDVNELKVSKINKIIAKLRLGSSDNTFEKILAAGHLFYTEYSILKGLSRVEDAYLYEPIVLFTLTHHDIPSKRKLMPLAIQLSTSSADDKWYFPPSKNCSDSQNYQDNECMVWMFAKMHASSADGNVHEALVHLGMTHVMIEPISIAAQRQFGHRHPIFRLLDPHFYQTLGINDQGRKTLLTPNGIFQQITALGLRGSLELINRGFSTLEFSNFTFPKRMQAAGFEKVPKDKMFTEEDPLPGYLYRDYGWMLWDSIHKYVNSSVYSFYDSNEALLADSEVQGWAMEVSSPKFANVHGFPSSIGDRDAFVDLLATIIFTASVQHSGVNFGQFDGYGFVPNRPLTLTKPMPADPKDLTMSYILEALPNENRAFGQMAITFALSTPPEQTGDNIPFAEAIKNAVKLSPDPAAFVEIIKHFIGLNEEMRKINAHHGWTYYTYLYPDSLAVSIAI